MDSSPHVPRGLGTSKADPVPLQISHAEGWTEIDGFQIPYLHRSGSKYIPVGMVERKLLSRYPNHYPDELGHHPALKSQCLTQLETELLNRLTTSRPLMRSEFGEQKFSVADQIVKLSDFVAFYEAVKAFCSPHTPQNGSRDETRRIVGGWVQVNNTLVPYLKRPGKPHVKLLPLAVIRYGAGLLTDWTEGLASSSKERQYLTDSCNSAGLEFDFTCVPDTCLVALDALTGQTGARNVEICELPPSNPLRRAKYKSNVVRKHGRSSSPCNRQTAVLGRHSTGAFKPYRREAPPLHPAKPMSVDAKNGSGYRFPRPTPTHQPHVQSTNQLGSTSLAADPVLSCEKRTSRVTDTSTPGASSPKAKDKLSSYDFCSQRHNSNRLSPPSSDIKMAADFPPVSEAPLDLSSKPAAVTTPRGHDKTCEESIALDAKLSTVSQRVEAADGATTSEQSATVTSTGAEASDAGSRPVTPKRPVIRPVDFQNKTVSCLIREEQREEQSLALVECVVRVYFPQCTVQQLLTALHDMLNVALVDPQPAEEKALLAYYGWTREALQCSKLVNLKHLELHMRQLKSFFQRPTGRTKAPRKC